MIYNIIIQIENRWWLSQFINNGRTTEHNVTCRGGFSGTAETYLKEAIMVAKEHFKANDYTLDDEADVCTMRQPLYVSPTEEIEITVVN